MSQLAIAIIRQALVEFIYRIIPTGAFVCVLVIAMMLSEYLA